MKNQYFLPLSLFAFLVLGLTITALNAEIIDDDTPVPPVGAL